MLPTLSMLPKLTLLLLLGPLDAGPAVAAPPPRRRPPPPPPPPKARRVRPPWAHDVRLEGLADVYPDEAKGQVMTSGERYKPCRRRAAHRTLPLGTRLRVYSPSTGRKVKVIVADRGPEDPEEVLLLSRRAGRKLRILDRDQAPVHLEILGCRDKYGQCPE